MVTATNATLTALTGQSRPLGEWLTTFPLGLVVIDPYTNESAWILDTAKRILTGFQGADVRVGWLVTAGPGEARAFLGPLSQELFTFVDPDRSVVRAFGLEHLPAFVYVLQDGSVAAAAEGWNPAEWRQVAEAIATTTSWTRPVIPSADDPQPYAGTPVLG